MSKYSTLVNVLDQLRNEAPPEYKSYYPDINETDERKRANFMKG
jgi:hypothetical protein